VPVEGILPDLQEKIVTERRASVAVCWVQDVDEYLGQVAVQDPGPPRQRQSEYWSWNEV